MPTRVIADHREEIVKDRTIELPPASPAHARLIQQLTRLLHRLLFDRAHSWCIYTSSYALGVEREPLSFRNPDIAVFRHKDLETAVIDGNNIFAVPRLIVECLSPRDRKGALNDLLEDYHRMGAIEVLDHRSGLAHRLLPSGLG